MATKQKLNAKEIAAAAAAEIAKLKALREKTAFYADL